ncbi:hypothetical protein, no similarity [Maudiozyma saulgeensis]|uniref:Uncharacterized protein n=1 Tax=Maudiozyma saulgeensis TaxID=1789683 RepID=A0A1X7RAC6_9SACH|nr:hypothetical protein, no similarity [Kazachstania saulgeensis]
MSSQLEKQDLFSTCTIVPFGRNAGEFQLNVCCSMGPEFINKNLPNSTDDWESYITECNGSVTLLTMNQTDNKYIEAMKCYNQWNESNPNCMLLGTFELTWFGPCDEKCNSPENKTLSCTITGNMLIISGDIPEINIMLQTIFTPSLVESYGNLNLPMFGICDTLIKNLNGHVKYFEKRIRKETEETAYKTYLYSRSTKKFFVESRMHLLKLSKAVDECGEFILLLSKMLVDNKITDHKFNNEKFVEKTQNRIAELFIVLKDLKEVQEINRAKTFDSIGKITKTSSYLLAVVLVAIGLKQICPIQLSKIIITKDHLSFVIIIASVIFVLLVLFHFGKDGLAIRLYRYKPVGNFDKKRIETV